MSAPEEPAMTFNTGDGEVLATRHNTKLYTFIGEAAMYDHAFVVLENLPEANRVRGTYFFKVLVPEAYNFMSKFIIEHGFPANINYPEASECDVKAFNDFAYGDVESNDSFPEEWVNE